uniref:Putative ovule protein n=1 Tax=Solanum chacoense TaxID=4108 RepID=A0A0V0INV7_SOLCH
MTFQKINTSLVLIIFFAVQYTASTQNNTNIHFVIEDTSFDRLCQSKKILTINGRFPGPTIYARAGETLALDVENKGKDNVTMFCCRGVGRHMKFDQVEWLVEAGSTVRKNITISDDVEGTLWWHAMNIWQRATVHGAFIVHPKPGKPDDHVDIPIILGEWWKKDVKEVFLDYIDSGSDIKSDAFTVNGQPGDFYPCSNNGMYKSSSSIYLYQT